MLRLPLSLRRYTALGHVWLAAGFLAGAAASARAQAPAAGTPAPLAENASLKQLMTPEEFKAAGLNKLSPDQLAHLERFLQGYHEQTVQQVAKATEERVNPAPKRNQATRSPVVENAINGPFEGLTGRTRVVLKNGSIWQQANENDKFRCHLDSPDVVLVRNIAGYKMYVTGAPHWFYAKQIVVE